MGRKANFVKGPDGKDIYGLSYTASVKCHYATFSKPRKWFKKDFAASIFEFYKWKALEGNNTTEMYIPQNFSGSAPIPCGKIDWEPVPDPVISETYDGETVSIPESLFLEQARNLILMSPIVAAKKLGIPQLASLTDLPKPEPALTLRQVANFYYEHRKSSRDELRKCRTTWKNFCKVVQIKEVRELEVGHIQKYKDKMLKIQGKNDWSSTWIRGKFNRVKTLLKYSQEKGIRNLSELERVLGLCKRLSVTSVDTAEATPISRGHFHLLLDNADVKWRAMYLLALNCGYYAKDIHDLKKSMIHHKNGLDYIVFPREKTKHMRVNVQFRLKHYKCHRVLGAA